MTYLNHAFDHWNTAADNSGATYQGGALLTLSSNTTLYAQWTLLTGSITAPSAFPAALGAVVGSASNPASVAISGSGTLGNIIATAPTGLEVSSDGVTYGPTATNPPAGGPLYARLSASAALGTYNSLNVVLSSTGALPVTVATTASGNVVVATPYWAVAASGNWGAAGNWFASTIASGSGVTADFSQVDITNDTTVHLNSSSTVGNLIFGDSNSNSAANWIVDDNGSSGANTLTLAGISPTVTVTNLGTGKTATISAVILGTNGLTTAGPGTLVLAGANRFTNNTRIAGGTLQLNNALALQYSTLDMNTADTGTLQFGGGIRAATLGGLQGSRNIGLVNTTNGAVTLSVGTNNASTSYAGVLSGTGGGLTKAGAGSLTLSGANTYTGPTIVSNGGTLNVTTLATGAGAYSVSNAATLGVTLANVGSSLTTASLTLGTKSTDATTLNLNQSPAVYGNPTNALVNVTGALKVNGTNTLNLANGALFPGQFPLIQYGSQTGIGGIVLGTLPVGVIGRLTNNAANQSLDLVVTGNNNLLYWNGNVSAVWDVNTTANWQSLTNTGLTYADTNQVIFDDTAAGNFDVTLNSAVQPMNVTFSNNVNNYSISGTGSIGGYTGLTVSGGGVVTISNANSFSGPTTVSAGALVLKNLGAVAGSSLNIADGAVVQPMLNGTYSNVTTTINGSSRANSSFGGSLDFHNGTTTTWPGPINLNDPSATIGCWGSYPKVTLTGQLTGSGSLTLRPEGGSASVHTATFTLSNPNNNYAGSTTMQVGQAELSATLQAGVNNALPVTTTLTLDHVASSGTVYFDLAGYSQTLAGLTGDVGTNAVINSTGTGTLTVSNTADSVFNGVIGASGQANINLVKQGSAALTLNSANLYTGSTTIGGGTLTLNSTNTYTGNTILGAGTLVLNGLITATSGWQMSNNATLQLALGAPGGPTNIVVKGNVTLAGQISASDFGIVSNTRYPVIYYSGKLTNNGVTIAPSEPCAFTIDTNTPHMVYLDVTQKYPAAEFTSVSSAVSTLTTNLSGVLNGTPAGPIWYEVRDQTNKLWDFGATRAVSPWSITVRHLRAGTNTVTIYAQDNGGNTQSNSIQLTLTLGTYPSVRPRPIPSEIWWGGFVDNSQLTSYSQWPFVQKYEDGFFLRGVDWPVPDTAALQQSLATNLSPFNTKYAAVLGGMCYTPSTNWYQSETNSNAGIVGGLQSSGIVLSEITHDYHMENLQLVCQVNPTWKTNDDIAWWTGDLSIASTNYPYTNPPSGIWRDVFNGYYQMFPHLKVGHISQPEYWPWGSYPSGIPSNNQLAFTITNSSGQNINLSFNASNIFSSFMNMAGAIGHPYFSMQSDSPWNFFYGGTGGTLATATTMRQMIRAYEKDFQSRGCRHTLICNVSDAGQQTTTNATDLYYETNSFNSMRLHQQEGGRANGYRFQSWYQGIPYVVAAETQPGSFTHLALSGIKYLKGIADTNGTLEQLNITPTATNGTVVQLQLQNNGDVQCLPALAGQPGTVPGVITRYFTTNGLELTATVLTAEGFCFTNLLQPGGLTNVSAVTLANGLAATTNDNAMLEAFWNPQDPLGIVRSRALFTAPLYPLGFWQDADIGSVGVTGGSALTGTTFTLLGSGADIGGTNDAFHFVYQTNNGNGAFIVRISSQLAADPSSKAGVMIREDITAGARSVFVGITPGNGVSFQNRATTNGASSTIGVGGIATPSWVQMVRSGTTFNASYSTNGVNWIAMGSSNVTGFASTALWGLAVTAHNNALASAATFDNVTPPNASPVLNPIADQTLIAGQTLTRTNTATDPNSPPQILTFSLLFAPIGMTLNPTNGILVWRPAMAQAPSTNLVTVQVADNGTPMLSATNSFSVTVNPPVRPELSGGSYSNGIFNLTVSGDIGPDYVLQTSTNLNLWQPVMTNYSPNLPFNWNVPSATNQPAGFFRVKLQP